MKALNKLLALAAVLALGLASRMLPVGGDGHGPAALPAGLATSDAAAAAARYTPPERPGQAPARAETAASAAERRARESP